VIRALVLVTALIVYGCLYPFRFHSFPSHGWDLFWHAWPATLDRFTARDTLINLLLYLPFGALAFLALHSARNAWLRLLLPAFLALVLSTTLEFLQLMDFTRTSSVYDVVCNVAGATLGVAATRRYADPLRVIIENTQRGLDLTPSPAVLLFLIWIAYQLFPLFPAIGLFAIRVKVRTFYTQSLSLPEASLALIEWLIVATLLRKVLPALQPRLLLLFLLVFLVRLLLLGRSLTLSEVLGALLGCILWRYWLGRTSRAPLVLGAMLIAALLLLDLAPFHFVTVPHPFSWFPFAGFIETGPDWGAVVFLKKSFWYGAAVWALAEAGAGYLSSAAAVTFLLGLLEWTQRYLPGRLPEITDPILALMIGALMYLFQHSFHGVRRA
jgi:VanZ family protein